MVNYEIQADENPTAKTFRKTKNGKKVKSKGRPFICNKDALINIIVYETTARTPENPNPTEQEERLRASFYKTNATNRLHPFFTDFGKPNYVELHIQWAAEIAKKIIEEWEKKASAKDKENIKISSKLKGESQADREQMMKAYYMYDTGISLAHDELENLAINQQHALIDDIDKYFKKRFTGHDEEDGIFFSAFHPKFEKGKWQSHIHSKIPQFSFAGDKLSLDNNYLRMQIIGCETENHPHFSKYLGKTITNALDKKHAPKTLEEFELFQSLITENITDDMKNPRAIKKSLVDKKIKIYPIHEGNELKDAYIEHGGSKIKVSSLMNKKCKTLIDRYLKLGELEMSTKVDSTKLVEDTQALVESLKNKSKKEFIKTLEDNGILLIPSVTKIGGIQGYSFYFTDLEKKMTISSLGMNKSEFPFSEITDIELLRNLAQKNKVRAGLAKPKDIKPPVEIALTGGFNAKASKYKKRKRMTDYETIDDYMADSGGMFDISLKKFSYSEGKFYRGKKEKLSINYRDNEKMNVTVKGDDMQTARAAIQLFLENGFNTVKLDPPSNDKSAANLWRAAMEMGVKFSGYQPTADDQKWLKELQDKKLLEKREQNKVKLLEAHKEGALFRIAHVKNQWHDLDRRTIAYAFVDALRAGIDPITTLTRAKSDGKQLVTIADLQEQTELIMEIVKNECPERSSAVSKSLATLHHHKEQKPTKTAPIEAPKVGTSEPDERRIKSKIK